MFDMGIQVAVALSLTGTAFVRPFKYRVVFALVLGLVLGIFTLT